MYGVGGSQTTAKEYFVCFCVASADEFQIPFQSKADVPFLIILIIIYFNFNFD